MKKLVDIAKAASRKATHEMGSALRSSAEQSGWDANAISGTSISYNGKFAVKMHPNAKNQILDLEYGTEATSPTAVVRKFSNKNESKDIFAKEFLNELGWKL